MTVLIKLIDVNDNKPLILPIRQTFKYTETNEKPFQPTFLHLFHVSDADKIDHGKLTLRIISGNDNNVFAVNKWRHLYINKNIDYEQQQQYHLVVRVTDGGNPYRHSDSHIYIQVEDQNDNPPVLHNVKPTDVVESTFTGTNIATITATDVDISNTFMRFGVEPNSQNKSYFVIDEFTGVISLNKPLDFELKKIFVINVTAFDGIHTTRAPMIINVLDANDNKPQFTSSIYSVNVSRSLKENSHIARVIATDADSGLFGRVQYKIDPDKPQDHFTIEQDTGNIFTSKDYTFSPSASMLELTVVAFDNNERKGHLSSKAVVKLVITGNHSPNPIFTKSIYKMSISEGANIGAAVGQVLALFPTGGASKIDI